MTTYRRSRDIMIEDLEKRNKRQAKPRKNLVIDLNLDKEKLLKPLEYSKGGRAQLRGGGMSQRGLGKAFKKGGKV